MKFEHTKNLIIKLMKHECDINYDIARIWLKYLENKKSEDFSDEFARICISGEIEKILKSSVIVHKDHYMKWIEGEFDNDLPIASSGSTITALLLYITIGRSISFGCFDICSYKTCSSSIYCSKCNSANTFSLFLIKSFAFIIPLE